MKNPLHLVLWVGLIITYAGAARGVEPGRAPSEALAEKIDQLERSLPALMEEHHIPGVSVAVIENRALVWSEGFGVRCAGHNDPVQPDTVFEGASLSKAFYAYLYLQLVQEGTAKLDRPLVEYFGQDYLEHQPKHREITARMVLSHTSGLPSWRPGGPLSNTPPVLQSDPGTAYQYSGEGFFMLQKAMEKATGIGLDDLSREKLIKPLGMKHTRFVWDDELMATSSCGHDHDGNVKTNRPHFDDAHAGYSLYTSAEDYALYLVEMLRLDRSAKHALSKELITEMLTKQSHREEPPQDRGLGWRLKEINGQRMVSHSGSNRTGFRCYAEFLPDSGDGLVIMTNGLNGRKLLIPIRNEWHGLTNEPVKEKSGAKPAPR